MPAHGGVSLTEPAALAEPLLELPRFTGPLDLLLSLVEQRRLPITDISLATVADQYLGYLAQLEEPDRDLLARFVSVGGRLLLLKSRSLLPREAAAVDDGANADDLIRALEEFRLIRRAVDWLDARGLEPAFPRGTREQPWEGMAPLASPAPIDLEQALRRLLSRATVVDREVPTVSPRVRVTVAARLADLRERLVQSDEIDWDDVAGSTIDSVIATFLAVLELIRRGEISVAQESTFGAIRLLALRDGDPVSGEEGGISPDAEYA